MVSEKPPTVSVHVLIRLVKGKSAKQSFDDLDLLRESRELRELLAHYTEVGARDRHIWQDRVMQMEGVAPEKLAKLHGALIAFQWIEQNTGNTPVSRPGVVPACYRATAAGVRALRDLEKSEVERDGGETPFSEAA